MVVSNSNSNSNFELHRRLEDYHVDKGLMIEGDEMYGGCSLVEMRQRRCGRHANLRSEPGPWSNQYGLLRRVEQDSWALFDRAEPSKCRPNNRIGSQA